MGHRVLIVEDQDSMALVLGHLARREGYATTLAADPDATVRALAGAPLPDLVLLDADLAGRAGLDLCQTIRGDARLAGVRILVLSARCARLDIERAFALGADAFLPKPFAISDLGATLRALLEPEPLPAAAEARHG